MHDNVIHFKPVERTDRRVESTDDLSYLLPIRSLIADELDRSLPAGVLLAQEIILLAATMIAVVGGRKSLIAAMARATAAAQSQATTD